MTMDVYLELFPGETKNIKRSTKVLVVSLNINRTLVSLKGYMMDLRHLARAYRRTGVPPTTSSSMGVLRTHVNYQVVAHNETSSACPIDFIDCFTFVFIGTRMCI